MHYLFLLDLGYRLSKLLSLFLNWVMKILLKQSTMSDESTPTSFEFSIIKYLLRGRLQKVVIFLFSTNLCKVSSFIPHTYLFLSWFTLSFSTTRSFIDSPNHVEWPLLCFDYFELWLHYEIHSKVTNHKKWSWHYLIMI